jgi:NADP-dependent 3-hydroxy acid dehydrogenase YdfG
MSLRSYQDKVVVITGASSGIGAAMAEALAQAGARLVLAARRTERLEELITRLPGGAERAMALRTDVVDDDACRVLVEQTLARFGRLDVLILNAGISTNAKVQELGVSVARRVMEVNYFGAVQPFLHAVAALVASRGKVIVISSLAGKKGMATRAAYSGSKFALHGFFDAARADLRQEGVSIMLACPGYVESEVRQNALKGDGTPQGVDDQEGRKMQTAEDCAREILAGAAAGKRELIMGGFGPRLLCYLEPFVPEFTERAAEKVSARET